jgi:thioredoxin 1
MSAISQTREQSSQLKADGVSNVGFIIPTFARVVLNQVAIAKHVMDPSLGWHGRCLYRLRNGKAVENMNPSQSKASFRLIGEADFASKVLQSSKPILVVFWAPWSRPCQILDSTLTELEAASAGRVEIVKINADDQPDLSLWYDIQSVPTLLYFVAGRVQAKMIGTASKEAILAKLNLLKP